MLHVVCVNCGEKYGDIYVDRLYAMVSRHLHVPFDFTCFTDRPRQISGEIIQFDTTPWALRGWFNKLKLLDAPAMPYDSMLFFDISLIIKADLQPLVDYVQDHPFVIVRDWHYDCFNSCVMWITGHDRTQQVWAEYMAGTVYQTRHHGDQDFIHAVFRANGWLASTCTFPPSWIVSYKNLRRTRRFAPTESAQLLDGALVLKFHGFPKPHELLMPEVHIALSKRLFFFDSQYLVPQIRDWWQ